MVEEVVDSEISSIVESLSRALSDWLEVSTVVDIDSIRDIQKHHPYLGDKNRFKGEQSK